MANNPTPLRVAVITISDSVSAGKSEDKSGPAVVARCRELGWEIKSSLVIPDDPPSIREQLREFADSGRVDLILTTGGTGLSPRDSTPEATIAVADRLVPGFAEEMRRKGMEKTPRAILSRAVAAVRHKSLILNLPGSTKGAVESLDALADLLPHSIAIIHGARHD
ncbi:MAG TPA: MogA/MoaB family molybdenum cofactor biosynthesis protein [Candidatus Dormibacteraeota bacterium]|nr:MogA/MoaB family molybdenum cofactor biosynthesis protein [Candidatus Dormibacteraeota bacterium]